MQTAENQLTIIERSAEIFKGGGQILKANQDRSQKALAVGQNILVAIEKNEGRLNPELDQRCQKFLSNCGAAVTEMKDARAVVTQLMDELKKLYTEAENQIDPKKEKTIPARIQVKRDEYAKFLAEEEKRKREQADREARKAKLKLEYKAAIATRISSCLIDYLASRKQHFNASFNAITLADYAAKKEGLEKLAVEFNQSKLGEILNYVHPTNFSELDDIDKNSLRIEAHKEYNFESFYSDYRAQISEIKQSLIDRLPSKKAELEQIKKEAEEREQKRLADIAAAEEAERKRQEEIKRADGEKKKRLQLEATIAAENEIKRQQEEARLAEEERVRRENEIRQRETAEQQRIARETDEQKRKAENDIEMNKQAAQTMVLFEQETASISDGNKPEAREGYEIIVSHQAAFVQIFQFWFEREGKNLSIDKIGKTSLNQMKAFCEKTAFKTGEKIESKFLRYEETFKAVNRKAS
jgi:hypothetical protein